MDPDIEEDVFSDAEDPFPLREDKEEEDKEEEEEQDKEEDARIFNAWMRQYRQEEHQKRPGQEELEEEGESEGGRPESWCSLEPPVHLGRRSSLPCPFLLFSAHHHPCTDLQQCNQAHAWPCSSASLAPLDICTLSTDEATLSSMQLSRLHSSTSAPVTARVLLRRSSSRRLLPSPQEAAPPPLERRPSLIPTIPEAVPPERRSQFRRRNVMSLSDAYSMCMICHNELSQGSGGTRELQCTHTFHKECIEEWLWRKQSCPTCHVQVCMPQPLYWNSTRVKVP